eukprot:6375320-Pyramimonas_sp.AAC.1
MCIRDSSRRERGAVSSCPPLATRSAPHSPPDPYGGHSRPPEESGMSYFAYLRGRLPGQPRARLPGFARLTHCSPKHWRNRGANIQ